MLKVFNLYRAGFFYSILFQNMFTIFKYFTNLQEGRKLKKLKLFTLLLIILFTYFYLTTLYKSLLTSERDIDGYEIDYS